MRYLAASLVLFWGAAAMGGAAYAGPPPANLSVQVVPAVSNTSACTLTGQAAADVATAGFNTIALCLDFTTQIPNSVGTGLPSNWLDCAGDGDLSSIWHWGFLYPGLVTVPPCSGHIQQAMDPSTGGLAMRLSLSDSDVATYGSHVALAMQTQNLAATTPATGPGNYPYGYFEWTFRSDQYTDVSNGFWTWVGANAQTLAGAAPNYTSEFDFTETGRPGCCSGTDQAIDLFSPGGSQNDYYPSNNGAGLPYTAYHTWGGLLTGDGGLHFSLCAYLDGVQQGCINTVPFDVANENLQRHFLIWWLQYGGATSLGGTTNQYVTNMKVLSCSNWTSAAPSGMCPGHTLNSRGFYQ